MIFKHTVMPLVGAIFFCLVFASNASAGVRGIYISQSTLENTAKIKHLIAEAKDCNIDTFVIDLEMPTNAYDRNIELVEENNIKYVARIVVFPDGGNNAQVLSKAYWHRKYKLVEDAIDFGASEIQLDYIRYKSSQPSSTQNAKNIHTIIKWFKNNLAAQHIPLQIDVFGISSFGSSPYIGHDLQLFADSVDAMCPMVYPSHFAPYLQHAKDPYGAVRSLLDALYDQFNDNPPFKVYPFIEVYNFRHPLSAPADIEYIRKQIKAAEDSNTDGWYVWSANNKYKNLFTALRKYYTK